MGKKSIAPKVRKDVWMPFATVHFPIPQQGLAAMRKLREYRRLRELSWHDTTYDPKSLLTPKKQMMRQMMAYKPYAVADLADILLKQEAEGKELTAKLQKVAAGYDRKIEAARAKRRQELIDLMKRARNGEVIKVEKNIPGVLEQWRAATGRRKLALRRRLGKLHTLKKALTVSQECVKWNWWKFDWQVSEEEIRKNRVELKRPKIRRKGKRKYIVPEKQLRESFVPSAEGIRIDWYNLKDAEYAAKWPNAVAHAQFDRPSLLERSRHGHIRPTSNPAMVPAWNAAFRLAAKAAEHAKLEDQKAVKEFISKVMHRKHKHYKLTKAPGVTPALMIQNGQYKQVERIRYQGGRHERSRDIIMNGRLFSLPLASGSIETQLQAS